MIDKLNTTFHTTTCIKLKKSVTTLKIDGDHASKIYRKFIICCTESGKEPVKSFHFSDFL